LSTTAGKTFIFEQGLRKDNHAITKMHMENECTPRGWKNTWWIIQDTRN